MTPPDAAHSHPHARVVAVAGASGLVGRALVKHLCADPSVAAVHLLVRSPMTAPDAKAHVHQVDFANLPDLPALDEVYLALGTTLKVAGSQARFRAVDFDANLAVAHAALAAGAQRIGLVSTLGADPASRFFYNRVKGELEQALSALPLQALVIARPSLLLGERTALGQPRRRGETLAALLDRWLRPLIPLRYRGIAAEDVAAALANTLPQAQGKTLLSSQSMQGASTPALKSSGSKGKPYGTH